MKRLSIFAFLLLFALPAAAQFNYARRIYPLPALPAVCNPGNGDIAFLTTGNVGGYYCSALNTWVGFAGRTVTGIVTAATFTRTDAGHVHIIIANPAGSSDWGIGTAGEAHIDVGLGAEINMRIAGVDKTIFDANGMIRSVGVAQGALGAPANGTFVYCSDCTIASPCAAGGTGALAKRLNGAWVCN